MPEIYQKIANVMQNSRDPASEIKKLALDDPAWRATPGGKIINSLSSAKKNFPGLFDAFVAYAPTAGWAWDPDITGAHKGALLDGARSSGECALFAANLKLLAEAPPPYGLGLVNKIDWIYYSGENSTGFVAYHAGPNIIGGLPSNVVTPTDIQKSSDLYFWSNHKVLGYDGVVYDPSYGTIVWSKEAMALYHVARNERVEKNDETYFVTEGLANRKFLFRIVKPTERPGKLLQGPLDSAGILN